MQDGREYEIVQKISLNNLDEFEHTNRHSHVVRA